MIPDPDPTTAPDAGAPRMTTDYDPLETHLDALGDALRVAAAAPAPRRRTRPLIATAAAVGVAAIGAVVVVAASPRDGPVDVLGRAEAALSPTGELLHYVVRTRGVEPTGGLSPRVLGTGGRCPPPPPTEVWQARSPSRWRAVIPASANTGRCQGTMIDRHGHVLRGTWETSWAGGTSTSYWPAVDRMKVIGGYDSNSSQGNVPLGDPHLGGDDPVEVVRRMLRQGKLRDDGETTLDGRKVHTLSGTKTETAHRITTRETVLYAVDATTFAPVRAISTVATTYPRNQRGIRNDPRLRAELEKGRATQLDFVTFERRPLDAAGRRLLTIVPRRPPVVVERTTQARLRAERRAEVREQRRRRAAQAAARDGN
ncbi:hypothetical protein AB0L40_16740 [Patulibacter sp. NPDC049589]|uniref:hypothetical protein n=1 Tax=Patulibacter sp. NPDC049589 TaxID=3154731 RepID=UPI003445FE7E